MKHLLLLSLVLIACNSDWREPAPDAEPVRYPICVAALPSTLPPEPSVDPARYAWPSACPKEPPRTCGEHGATVCSASEQCVKIADHGYSYGVCIPASERDQAALVPLTYQDGLCLRYVAPEVKAAACCADQGADCRTFPRAPDQPRATGELCTEHANCKRGLLCLNVGETNSIARCMCPEVEPSRVVDGPQCITTKVPPVPREQLDFGDGTCATVPGLAGVVERIVPLTCDSMSVARGDDGTLHVLCTDREPSYEQAHWLRIQDGALTDTELSVTGEGESALARAPDGTIHGVVGARYGLWVFDETNSAAIELDFEWVGTPALAFDGNNPVVGFVNDYDGSQVHLLVNDGGGFVDTPVEVESARGLALYVDPAGAPVALTSNFKRHLQRIARVDGSYQVDDLFPSEPVRADWLSSHDGILFAFNTADAIEGRPAEVRVLRREGNTFSFVEEHAPRPGSASSVFLHEGEAHLAYNATQGIMYDPPGDAPPVRMSPDGARPWLLIDAQSEPHVFYTRKHYSSEGFVTGGDLFHAHLGTCDAGDVRDARIER